MIQWKDKFYGEFLNNPSKDTFSSFIHNNFGELNCVDFKGEWIHKGHLAKTLLAMANSHGGVIVFGVIEKEDGSIIPNGLTKFEDKASIGNEVAKYISPNLDFEILDFDYDTPIYPNAQNRKFQMILVHDTPERLPFVSLAETTGLDKDIIYVRRDTKCEKATAEEIENIISKKLDTVFKETSNMSLKDHLMQLVCLYNELPKKVKRLVRKADVSSIASSISSILSLVRTSQTWFGQDEYEEIDNPNYPEESYEAFILRMIKLKKLKIEKVLDLK